MKKIVTGGFLSLTGTIWVLAVVLFAANNPVPGWSTPPGRLLTTVHEYGLTAFLVIAAAMTLAGIALMLIGCFGKEK